MFLTPSLGFGARMVVTGDVSQIDLPGKTRSGLNVVQDILTGIEDLKLSAWAARGRGPPLAGDEDRRRLRPVGKQRMNADLQRNR